MSSNFVAMLRISFYHITLYSVQFCNISFSFLQYWYVSTLFYLSVSTHFPSKIIQFSFIILCYFLSIDICTSFVIYRVSFSFSFLNHYNSLLEYFQSPLVNFKEAVYRSFWFDNWRREEKKILYLIRNIKMISCIWYPMY